MAADALRPFKGQTDDALRAKLKPTDESKKILLQSFDAEISKAAAQ